MKSLKDLLAAQGVQDPEALAKKVREYYGELLPKPIAKQLEGLESGKEFDYKPVIRERLEKAKGNVDDFLEDFSEDSEKVLKDLEGKAKEQYKEAKSFFSKMFKDKGEGQKKEEDDIKTAKDALDKKD